MRQIRIFLAHERRTTLAWGLGAGAFLALIGGAYVAMGGEDAINELWANYPDSIKEAIGISEIATVKGFLDAEAGLIFPVVFAIMLVTFMTRHLAGAEEAGRLDHALARPISRSTYYCHLVLAAVVAFATILLVATIGAVVGFMAVAPAGDLIGIAGLLFDMLPLGYAFIGLGGLLGALFHRRSVANGVGVAFVAGFFALTFVARLAPELAWVRWLSPMAYLARSDLFHGRPDLVYVGVMLVAGTLAATLGWVRFRAKDLYA